MAVLADVDGLADVKPRLLSRQKISPEVFSATMKLREETHHLAPYTPVGEVETLFPDTWYLEGVDELHRRVYRKKSVHVGQNGHA